MLTSGGGKGGSAKSTASTPKTSEGAPERENKRARLHATMNGGKEDPADVDPFVGMTVIQKPGNNSWKKSRKMSHVPSEQRAILKKAVTVA